MANIGLMQNLFGRFPFLEIMTRNIYWRNIHFFSRFNRKKEVLHKEITDEGKISIEKIFSQWEEWGVVPGDILLLTSSYVELEALRLEPEEILNAIIHYLGPEGTLVMPAFPYFKNMPKKNGFLEKDISSEIFKYDAKKNFVTTGLLPGTLVKYANAKRSSFPINTLVAYGKYADEMFRNEWNEKDPLPCGKGSAWKFCADKNAKIVSLGTDLTHSLTMTHVAEDANDQWPIRSWYRDKIFLVSEAGIQKEVVLRERDPRWGTLHFAERKLCNDLMKNGMVSTTIDGILTEKIDSLSLLGFLDTRNRNGYPYYCIPRKYKTK